MSAIGLDRTIAQALIQRLATRGIRSPCRIDVQSRNGEVTLSGNGRPQCKPPRPRRAFATS